MAEILRCRSITDVVALIESGYCSFYGKYDLSHELKIRTDNWKPNAIKDDYETQSRMPVEENMQRNYSLLRDRNMLSNLKQRMTDFAATVRAYTGSPEDDQNLEVTTRIFNSTLLKDVLHGQIFQPNSSSYVITSTLFPSYRLREFWNSDWWIDKWIKHRNNLIAEAQTRIFPVVVVPIIYKKPTSS